MRGVVLTAILFTAQAVMARQIERINPPGLSTPATYSHIVKAGDILYIAGQVGADAQGKVVGPGMVEQVEQVMKNVDAFRAPDAAAVRAKYFGTNRPAAPAC